MNDVDRSIRDDVRESSSRAAGSAERLGATRDAAPAPAPRTDDADRPEPKRLLS